MLSSGALPEPSDRRLAVRVTSDALRWIRSGHPWVYDRSIVSTNAGGAPGDLAVVFDARRRFAAIGLWDPHSPIRIRVLAAGAPVTIDRAWFESRIRAAVERRSPLWAAPGVERTRLGFRAVNGENDGLGGLVVDCYADVVVVKLYSAAWFAHLEAVLAGVVDACGARAVVLRFGRNVARNETYGLVDGDVVIGDLADRPVEFEEAGLVFEADVRRGQKTGYFLDQRANRRLVRSMASGCSVLDVFAATGGFTVHAAAGGARSVHAVDASAPTLAVAQRNVERNRHLPQVAACRVTTEVGDAFDVLASLARTGRRFDIVVVDPPSFASTAEAVDRALSAYGRLTQLALDVVAPGGLLVQASCSSRVDREGFYRCVVDAAARHGSSLDEVALTGHDIDHPVTFPEGDYLKAGFWRVARNH